MDAIDIHDLARRLDAARKDPALRCSKPRHDAKGREAFTLLPDPRAKKEPRRSKQVIPYGPHGAAFLQIDATGRVFCGHVECEGKIESVAVPPAQSAEALLES